MSRSIPPPLPPENRLTLDLISLENQRALYSGFDPATPDGERYSHARRLFSIPFDDWVLAGRPTAVHITAEFTISLPGAK